MQNFISRHRLILIPVAVVFAGSCFWLLSACHIGYSCPFHALTGLYCPGCGGTRAALALLSGQLLLSVHENPAVLLLAISGMLWYLEQLFAAIGKNRQLLIRNRFFWIVLLILWIIWNIFRNVMPALQPVM